MSASLVTNLISAVFTAVQNYVWFSTIQSIVKFEFISFIWLLFKNIG